MTTTVHLATINAAQIRALYAMGRKIKGTLDVGTIPNRDGELLVRENGDRGRVWAIATDGRTTRLTA